MKNQWSRAKHLSVFHRKRRGTVELVYASLPTEAIVVGGAKKGIGIDFSLEKRSLVELTLARTLARLGDPEGYETLIAYLDDNRANMAEFAHMALEELTGRNNGKDPQAWSQWLAAAKGSLKPIPPLERMDG